MRISRPCYNKPHRCPGWAGGGMRYAKVDRCVNGYLPDEMCQQKFRRLKMHQCEACGVFVLPLAIQYVDPLWWHYKLFRVWSEIRYRIRREK